MSEVRLVVREGDRDWSGTIHGSCADQAIAALSADPITLKELEAATARFAKPGPSGFFSNLSPGLCDEPYDAGLVVIDLTARLVVVDSTYSSPGKTGCVEYHDGRTCTQLSLRYHLADDWRFLSNGSYWQGAADERRRIRAAQPTVDPRGVFYGRPFLEFIARECLAAFARRTEIEIAVRAQWGENANARLAKELDISPDEVESSLLTGEAITPRTWLGHEPHASPFYDTLSQIHEAWLLTPRDDLNGACPREVALERHGHLGWDMQDRCDQWSIMGECPPGLAETSNAFLNGGFGTHELVKYYDLARELLWSCWGQLEKLAKSPTAAQRPELLTLGDFLTTEVPRLESVREAWFDTPDPECHGRTPRSIIKRERARIPEAVSGKDAMVDPDCPCCQMMADMPGPMFWHLDGCNQDNKFAFDTHHRTLEEWQQEQREWDEFSRRSDAKWAERKRLGVTDTQEPGNKSVWSRSFQVGDAEAPVGIRVFGLGCQLAELIVGLRPDTCHDTCPPETRRHIDQLNRDFGNLRELLQLTESSLAETLIDPVLQRFSEDLNIVASDCPHLAAQCESLINELRGLLDPSSQKNSSASWEHGDCDYPF